MTAPTPATPPAGETAAEAGGEGPLVLIVDDNEKNLKLATDVLRAGGLRTVEARTGEESLVLASEHLPDVILMDLRLPDMDGADACRALHDRDRTSRIPVVALSSLPAGAAWYRAVGFAGHLEKPFAVSEFAARVRSYCVARDGE